MYYKIKITETARNDIRSLPDHMRQRVRRAIDALSTNPLPGGAKELRGLPGRYRIRIDRWRIIYRIDQENVIVLLLRVRRKTGPETYQDLQ